MTGKQLTKPVRIKCLIHLGPDNGIISYADMGDNVILKIIEALNKLDKRIEEVKKYR